MKAIFALLILVPAIFAYSHSECSNLCYTLSNKYTAEVQQSLVEMNVCLNNCDQEILSASRFLSDCKEQCPQNDDMKSIYKCMTQCEQLQSFNLEGSKSTFSCIFYNNSNCASPSVVNTTTTNNITCGATTPSNVTAPFNFTWAHVYNRYSANVIGYAFNGTNGTCVNGTQQFNNVVVNVANATNNCTQLINGTTLLGWSTVCTFVYGQIQIFSLAFVLLLVILSFVI